MRFFLICVLFLFGCGDGVEHSNKRTSNTNDVEKQLVELKTKIQALELFTGLYTEGIDNPFSDCNTVTSSLEKKICQVAQTATATQQANAKSQLGTIAKEFQTTLYGADCVNTTDLGCPVTGSLMDKMSKAETDITTLKSDVSTAKSDISSIQSTISSMQTLESAMSSRLTALENRFNDFNGTTQSIETIITGIDSDISALQSDVAAIQGVIVPSRVINQYEICGDNPDSGPYFELLLVSGDKTKAYGSIKTGTWYGNGLFFAAGDTDALFTTHLNSKSCKFKMYNNPAGTKIQACWIKTNRAATEAQINAARTAATATCTPY